jgi:hypothetical protein
MLPQSLRTVSLYLAVVTGATGYALAAPAAKAPAQPAPAPVKPAQVKTTPDAPAAAKSDAPAVTPKPAPPAPVSADALALQYQRVGHELVELLAKRGPGHALDQCNDLDTEFHTIKINEALATPESRITAAATLTVLHERIVRWQGIQMARACLDNPLAPQCQ